MRLRPSGYIQAFRARVKASAGAWAHPRSTGGVALSGMNYRWDLAVLGYGLDAGMSVLHPGGGLCTVHNSAMSGRARCQLFVVFVLCAGVTQGLRLQGGGLI